MKKSIVFAVALCSIVLCGGLKAQAVFFTNTVDFAGYEAAGSAVTYKAFNSGLFQNDLINSFSYSHVINGITPGSVLNDAKLSVTYSGVNDESTRILWRTVANPELWLVTDKSSLLLGSLFSLDNSGNTSNFGQWVTTDYELGSTQLASIMNENPWELELRIGDHFPNSTIYLDKSVLSGNYTSPVPEPASMLLFGSGLLGLVGFAKRKFGVR